MRRWTFVGVLVPALAMAPMFGSITGAAAKNDGSQVRVEELPAPVKTTLNNKERKGGTVKEVRRESVKGQMAYEAEIVKNGKVRFVSIADNGKVLKRESASEDNRQYSPAK